MSSYGEKNTPPPTETALHRIHSFRRFQLRTRHLRALVLRSDDSEEARRQSSSAEAEAEGTRGGGQGAAEKGGNRGNEDEILVTRWVIVTDKRMLHTQEEPGWGADKEKVKALDLARCCTDGLLLTVHG